MGSMHAMPPAQPAPTQTVLVFLKSMATPVVLYTDNPVTLYEEIKRHIQQANPETPKLIEKPGIGPLKKVCFLDTELAGAALQQEPAMGR